MEAFFADSIDLIYVDPSSALNAYAKSRGEEVRIISGPNGGAVLVVQAESALNECRRFPSRATRLASLVTVLLILAGDAILALT